MPFIDLETGIRMHYRDGGKGKPILFVPGYSATVDTWNYAVLDLHERYRCVCVDLRGHGDMAMVSTFVAFTLLRAGWPLPPGVAWRAGLRRIAGHRRRARGAAAGPAPRGTGINPIDHHHERVSPITPLGDTPILTSESHVSIKEGLS